MAGIYQLRGTFQSATFVVERTPSTRSCFECHDLHIASEYVFKNTHRKRKDVADLQTCTHSDALSNRKSSQHRESANTCLGGKRFRMAGQPAKDPTNVYIVQRLDERSNARCLRASQMRGCKQMVVKRSPCHALVEYTRRIHFTCNAR